MKDIKMIPTSLNRFQQWGIKQGLKYGITFEPCGNFLKVSGTDDRAMTYTYVDHLCGIEPI